MRLRDMGAGFVFVLILIGVAQPLRAAQEGAVLNWDSAQQAFEKGDYEQTEQFLRQAWLRTEETNASATKRVSIMGSLAQVFEDQGRLNESEELFERTLKIADTEPVDPKARTVLLLNFAGLLVEIQHPDRAESLLKEAAVLCRQYFGEQSPQMAGVLKMQGIVYAKTDRLKSGEARLKKALAMGEKELSSQPGEFAAIMTSLAAVYTLEKKWESAETLYFRAINLLERSFGLNHPGVSAALVNLGEYYAAQGKLASAEAVLRRSLAMRQEARGPDNIEVAIVTARLAVVLTRLKRYDEARELFLSSLRIKERVLGGKSPDVASTLEEFAKLLRQVKDVAQAEAMEARVKYIREEQELTVSADELKR